MATCCCSFFFRSIYSSGAENRLSDWNFRTFEIQPLKKNPSLKWVRMKQCDIELNVRVGGELYLYSVYPSTTCFFGIEISRCILLFRIENSLHSCSSRSRAHNMWAHNAPIPSVLNVNSFKFQLNWQLWGWLNEMILKPIKRRFLDRKCDLKMKLRSSSIVLPNEAS